MYIKYRLFSVVFNSLISLLVFQLISQSTMERDVLQFPSTMTDLPISPCNFSSVILDLLLPICEFRMALLSG